MSAPTSRKLGHPAQGALPGYSLAEYLSEPCDDCEAAATHNGHSKVDGRRGRFCNQHTSWSAPAFARND